VLAGALDPVEAEAAAFRPMAWEEAFEASLVLQTVKTCSTGLIRLEMSPAGRNPRVTPSRPLKPIPN